jgi:tRNA uridine 5-carboxymethylaminomethyl modification enzyme
LEPAESSNYLIEMKTSPLTQKQKAAQVLLRPAIDLTSMVNAIPRLKASLTDIDQHILEQAEIQLKYEVYIEKEKELVNKMSQLEDLLIPETFNYDRVGSLSNEALQKFKKIKPRTLGQASRISGVNPSDVQILMVFMGR